MASSPTNKKLYEKVKKEAKARFKTWPSLYGSAWLSKEYKKRGGSYSDGSKKSKSPTKRSPKRSPTKATKGVNRWFREEWIQVLPYVTSGKKVPCGSGKNTKACRPLKRITDETPITIKELIKIHGKTKLATMARKKMKDMGGRLYWKTGTFKPSKA
jgi:hypothetical protein